MPDTRIGWSGLPQGRGTTPTFAEVAQHERKLEEGKSFGELQQLATEDQWLAYGGARAIERSESFKPDPTFSIPNEQYEGLRREFGYKEAERLKGVGSKDELDANISWLKQDLERQRKLAGYGLKGTAMQITMGLLDPIGWGAAIASEGVGAASKLESLGRIGRTAMLGAVENTAMESVMYAGDTQRSVDDVVLAAITGGVMGGTVGLMTRSKPEFKDLVDSYDNFDQVAAKEVHASFQQDEVKAASEVTPKMQVPNERPIGEHIKQAAADMKAEDDIIKEKVAPEFQEAEAPHGSVGAMKTVRQELFEMPQSKEELAWELENEGYQLQANTKIVSGKSKVAKMFQSAFATLASSENEAFAGLAGRLLENPQGNSFATKTASILSEYYGRLMRSAGKNRYNDGFRAYLKEQGHNPVKGHLNKDIQDDFDRQIYSAITEPDGNYSKAVQDAANGISDQLEVALKLRKEAGEAGFEHVESARDYLPIIYDGTKMIKAINKHGKTAVENVLTNGYMFGKFRLKQATARKIAQMQIIRTADATLSSRVSFDRVVSAGEQKRFLDELRQAGVPESDIESFVLDKEVRSLVDNASSRSKLSLGVNTSMEYNGLKVSDLLNQNVPELVENYMKEAAAGAALARKGFPTKQSVLDAIDLSERSGRNYGLPPKDMKEQADMLRQTVDLLYGHSLDANPSAGHVVAARRMRDYTALIRLGNLGFAQIPEVARAMAHLGVGTVLKSIPAVHGLRGRIATQSLKEPELREMEELLGYVGEDHMLTGWSVRHDEFGENPDVASRFGDMADRAMAAGARMNSVMSGFRSVQGSLEKITTRGLAKRLKDHLEGVKSMPESALKEAGFDGEFMASLKDFYHKNPASEGFNGRQVRKLNIEKMPDDMREKLGVGITRMSGRIIQRNFVGETSTWMNTYIGKMFTQFKSFSIVSAEKQLIHDMRGDKVKAAQTFLLSSMAAYATYMVQSGLQSLGRDNPEEYLNKKLDPKAVGFGIFNKMPQTASISLVGDMFAGMGMMPDSWMGSYGTGGFQPAHSVGDVIPSVGAAGDGLDVIRSMANYVKGDDSLSDRQLADKIRRAVPLMGAIGVGQLSKAAVNTLED